MQGPHRSGPVSIVARRAGVGLVGGGKKPFSRSSCVRARSSMSWALSGTTATTATSPAIASAPGPGPRLPPDACRRTPGPPRASLVQVFAGLATRTGLEFVGQAFQPAGSADFPVRRMGRAFRCRGMSAPSWGLTVPGTGRLDSLPYKGWRRRIVLGTDSPRNRQARQPALRTQSRSALRWSAASDRTLLQAGAIGCRRM